jgi:hypothetical protein
MAVDLNERGRDTKSVTAPLLLLSTYPHYSLKTKILVAEQTMTMEKPPRRMMQLNGKGHRVCHLRKMKQASMMMSVFLVVMLG